METERLKRLLQGEIHSLRQDGWILTSSPANGRYVGTWLFTRPSSLKTYKLVVPENKLVISHYVNDRLRKIVY